MYKEESSIISVVFEILLNIFTSYIIERQKLDLS